MKKGLNIRKTFYSYLNGKISEDTILQIYHELLLNSMTSKVAQRRSNLLHDLLTQNW
jgi:hypothetical protein